MLFCEIFRQICTNHLWRAVNHQPWLPRGCTRRREAQMIDKIQSVARFQCKKATTCISRNPIPFENLKYCLKFHKKTCMRAVNRQPWLPRGGLVETAPALFITTRCGTLTMRLHSRLHLPNCHLIECVHKHPPTRICTPDAMSHSESLS